MDDITSNCCVLLNPTIEQAREALRHVQARCRKNRLSVKEMESAWRKVVEGSEASVVAGLVRCPAWFTFPSDCTVLQLLRIDRGLIGLVIKRSSVPPGEWASAPVQQPDPELAPSQWFNEVIAAFWTILTPDVIETLRSRMLASVMRLAAAQPGSSEAVRAAHRRRKQLQLQILFRNSAPAYVSERADALQRIGAEMIAAGEGTLRWAIFQTRWPSIAARYRRDLIGLVRDASIAAEDLLQIADSQHKYAVSFDLWSGPQRLFADTQLVLQVCAPRQIEAWKVGGGETASIAATLQQRSTEITHPATTDTVGWLRIHVDDRNQLAFVDEVQSDWLESLHRDFADQAAARAVAVDLADWHMHGFAVVQRWCRGIGYRPATHSRASASCVTGMTPSERKWNIYYGALAKRFGLREQAVAGYPAPVCL